MRDSDKIVKFLEKELGYYVEKIEFDPVNARFIVKVRNDWSEE